MPEGSGGERDTEPVSSSTARASHCAYLPFPILSHCTVRTYAAWDFRIGRSALLYHVLTKATNRFHALHAMMHLPGLHCSLPPALRCKPDCTTRPAPRLSSQSLRANK